MQRRAIHLALMLLLLTLWSWGRAEEVQGDGSAASELSRTQAEQAGINPYVSLTDGGDLYYHPVNVHGDRIVDYGGAGYRNQGVRAIPSAEAVPVVVTVRAGDSIQAAIDELGGRPIGDHGYRGVIVVEPGSYSPFRINYSGIIVRGKDGARVVYRGKDVAIRIGGREGGDAAEGADADDDADARANEDTGADGAVDADVDAAARSTRITSYRVPTGSRSFAVADASAYRVGDTIRVVTTPNETWIRDIGMHAEQWRTNHLRKAALRRITAIDGHVINIDEPTTITIWDRHGGGYIQKTQRAAIRHVGIENLTIVGRSARRRFAVARAMGVNLVDDAFVRKVSVSGFQKSAVWVNHNARRVTLDHMRYRGAGQTGGSQRYGFQIAGEQVFCHALSTYAARHAFVPTHQSVGGTVFKDCFSMQCIYEAGGHRHWSGSVLWDNCNIRHSSLTARRYRGPNINHGWRAVNNVAWNSSARRIIFQNPPHAYNLALRGARQLPSLYEAQAGDRQGGIEFREYVLGDYDNFTGNRDERVDRVPVDPAWQRRFSPAKGFDDDRPDHYTPFTFTFRLNPRERIVGAQLTVRARLSGDVNQQSISVNDGAQIMFRDLGRHALLNGRDNVRTFDLARQLTLLQDGKLNVTINDANACVDYALLRLKVLTAGDASQP